MYAIELPIISPMNNPIQYRHPRLAMGFNVLLQ